MPIYRPPSCVAHPPNKEKSQEIAVLEPGLPPLDRSSLDLSPSNLAHRGAVSPFTVCPPPIDIPFFPPTRPFPLRSFHCLTFTNSPLSTSNYRPHGWRLSIHFYGRNYFAGFFPSPYSASFFFFNHTSPLATTLIGNCPCGRVGRSCLSCEGFLSFFCRNSIPTRYGIIRLFPFWSVSISCSFRVVLV